MPKSIFFTPQKRRLSLYDNEQSSDLDSFYADPSEIPNQPFPFMPSPLGNNAPQQKPLDWGKLFQTFTGSFGGGGGIFTPSNNTSYGESGGGYFKVDPSLAPPKSWGSEPQQKFVGFHENEFYTPTDTPTGFGYKATNRVPDTWTEGTLGVDKHGPFRIMENGSRFRPQGNIPEVTIYPGEQIHADDINPISASQAARMAIPSMNQTMGYPIDENHPYLNKKLYNRYLNEPRPVIDYNNGQGLIGYDPQKHKHIKTYAPKEYYNFNNDLQRHYDKYGDWNMLIESRADGGSVFGGRPYNVNEDGTEAFMPFTVNPELIPLTGGPGVFVPPVDGTIVPNSALSSTSGGIVPQGHPINAQPQTGGLYDYWKKPIVGNMPRDQFVQTMGLLANAFAPNSVGGRIGRGLYQMGGQANQDRMHYEAKQQFAQEQRAWAEQKYQEQLKEKRYEKFIEFANKSKNPALQKVAYDRMSKQWEQDFGTPLPPFNLEETPDIMKQLKEFRDASKDLGMTDDEVKKGETEILFAGGYLKGKEYLEGKYGKPDTKETWSDPYVMNVGGKKAMVQKSSHGQIRPVIQDRSTTVVTGGGKETDADKDYNSYLKHYRDDVKQGLHKGERPLNRYEFKNYQKGVQAEDIAEVKTDAEINKLSKFKISNGVRKYKTADDVNEAYKRGDVTYDEAAEILKKKGLAK